VVSRSECGGILTPSGLPHELHPQIDPPPRGDMILDHTEGSVESPMDSASQTSSHVLRRSRIRTPAHDHSRRWTASIECNNTAGNSTHAISTSPRRRFWLFPASPADYGCKGCKAHKIRGGRKTSFSNNTVEPRRAECEHCALRNVSRITAPGLPRSVSSSMSMWVSLEHTAVLGGRNWFPPRVAPYRH